MAATIAPENLKPGDVLLYHGTHLISKLIMMVDDAEVSHAGLYLGEGKVGEALGNGLITQDLTASVQGNKWVQARRLQSPPGSMSLVMARANGYLNAHQRYAYEQIVFLALLCLSRKLRVGAILSALIIGIVDRAASLLSKLLSGGKEPMICSEFVFRAYDEVWPGLLKIKPPVVGLGIALPPFRPGGTIHPESVLGRMAADPSLVRAMAPGPAHAMAACAVAIPSEGEIEQMAEAYMKEISSAPPEAPNPAWPSRTWRRLSGDLRARGRR
jgi:hypothetical protein